ncbi:MAG: hypothetical protein MUO50_16865, partial [Longimicrobiales bacterium]|nr:hypothetical protein [Longimicrobiales bacterium]
GPSFATEVSREAPTAVVVASRSSRAALNAQEIFQTEHFRVYTNPDVLGVELGSAQERHCPGRRGHCRDGLRS